MFIRDVRRQARSVVATTLAGFAAGLSAVAGVAETVAQELRLTMPEDEARDRPPSQPAQPGTSGPAPGPDLTDVTGATEGAPGAPADADVRVRVLDEDEVARLHPGSPEPVVDERFDEDVQVIQEAPAADEYPEEPAAGVAEPAPEPWVEDVAEAVAGGTVQEAIDKLPELTDTQLRALERYERGHRARVTLLRAVDDELTSRD
jgi:hypothetical protein